jgi:hypothetical protein
MELLMRNLFEEVSCYNGKPAEIWLNKKGVTTRYRIIVRVFYAFVFLIFSLGFNQPDFADATENSLERGGVIAINQRSEVIVTNVKIWENAAPYALNIIFKAVPDLISNKIVFFSSVSKYGDLIPYIPATEETSYTGDSAVGLNEREQKQYFFRQITHITITFLFFMLLGWFFGGGYNTLANEIYAIDRVIFSKLF